MPRPKGSKYGKFGISYGLRVIYIFVYPILSQPIRWT